MALLREIVYYCLDAVKSSNGDSDITEEHVIFLANHYRLFLIEQKKKKEGGSSLSSSNEQTICLDLEKADAIPGLDYCNATYLRSIQEIPELMDEESVKVNLSDHFNIMTAFVTKDRFKYVGHNKYLRNIIYCTLGPDNHIYFNGNNPQFLYLKKAQLTGIFEDAFKAAELACDKEGNKCDPLDSEFPIEADLLPQMLELIVKELLGVNYRPKDKTNNDIDDLADLASYVRRNMKSQMAKQMTD